MITLVSPKGPFPAAGYALYLFLPHVNTAVVPTLRMRKLRLHEDSTKIASNWLVSKFFPV